MLLRVLVSSLMLCLLGIIGFLSGAQAMPAQVLLLRHAEKPTVGEELSERGWQRARALPELFKRRSELTRFGEPAALFGMSPKRKAGSIRSIQTLTYLAEDLGLKIDTNYTGDDVEELVQDVRANSALDGKSVVICWHRENLPELAAAFGATQMAGIEKNTFDRVYLIQIGPKGRTAFSDLPQNLLPGDSAR